MSLIETLSSLFQEPRELKKERDHFLDVQSGTTRTGRSSRIKIDGIDYRVTDTHHAGRQVIQIKPRERSR